jgi:WD40 repeat protein
VPSQDGQFAQNGQIFATTSALFDRSGYRFAYNVKTLFLHVWDARTGAPYARWKLRSLQHFALSPDGLTVAIATGTAGGSRGGAQLRETRSGRLKYTLFPGGAIEAKVHSLAWSSDGRFVATGTGDGLARIWDAASGRRVATFRVGGYVGALAFSPDGQTLAAVGDAGRGWVGLYDWKRKKSLEGTRFHTYSIYATLRFAPDGKALAVGNESNGETVLYTVPGLQRIQSIPAPESAQVNSYLPVPRMAFSRDGRRVGYVGRNYLVVRDDTFRRVLLRRPMKRTGWGNSVGDYIVALQFLSDKQLCWATVRRSYDSSGNPNWSTPKIWFRNL